MPIQESLNALADRHGITYVTAFGQLQVFQNALAKPIIHGASDPIVVSRPTQSALLFDNEDLITHLKESFDSTAIVVEGQNDRSVVETLLTTVSNCSNPAIRFERMHPTEYAVHVNASTPFILVFTEAFDPQWRAYLDNEELGSHLTVNACSNAWVLNQTGQYDVRIKYVQQDLLVVGTILSTSAFAGCVAVIVARTKGEQIRKLFGKAKKKITSTGV